MESNHVALSSNDPVTSTSIVDEITTSLTTEDLSTAPSVIVSFNDRCLEVRDARLAKALHSLDEDLPHDADDSIIDFFKKHTNSTPIATSHINFLVDENYLEYKNNLAAKRSLEKMLPKSKSRCSSSK